MNPAELVNKKARDHGECGGMLICYSEPPRCLADADKLTPRRWYLPTSGGEQWFVFRVWEVLLKLDPGYANKNLRGQQVGIELMRDDHAS